MHIRIKSRNFFKNLQGTETEAEIFARYRIISINTAATKELPPFSSKYWNATNLLILNFDDVSDPGKAEEAALTFMSDADAQAIIRFALETNPSRPILIHCTAGISRSGAVGEVLNWLLNRKLHDNEFDYNSFVRSHPHIIPNLWVKNKLLSFLSNETINFRER